MPKSLPDVTVVVITYKRLAELQRTLDALKKNLQYEGGNLHFLVSDDSSPDNKVEQLQSIKRLNYAEFISTPHNLGWGGNANFAMAQAKTDYIFFCEDDYVLTRKIDLRVGVALMEVKPQIGMVRYRGTAGENYVFHQFEADLSEYLPKYAEGKGLEGKSTYLHLGSGSPSLYLYSNGPHLKHRCFHEFYGDYPEGLKLAHTEESYANSVKDAMRSQPDKAPAIVIYPEFVPMYFDHIGQSFQDSAEDRGN